MAKIPAKVESRIKEALKRFKPVAEQAKARDIGEADTSTLTEPILAVIRRELKRLSPDVKIEVKEIQAVLSQEVIKREVLEGEKAQEASRKITRAANRALRAKSEKEPLVPIALDDSSPSPAELPAQQVSA